MAQHCDHCSSSRMLSVHAHASDMFVAWIGKKEHEGYLPRDLGVGGGDDLNIKFCMACGRMDGTFPLPISNLEQQADPEDDEDY